MKHKATQLPENQEKASVPRPSKSESQALGGVHADLRITAKLKENANRTARLLYEAGRHVSVAARRELFLARLGKMERERNHLLVALGYPKSSLKKALGGVASSAS
jgi:hypothetical protein